MKFKAFITSLLLMCTLCVTNTFATEVTVSLEDLDRNTAAAVLKYQKDKASGSVSLPSLESVQDVDPELVEKWVSVFGKAFNNFCTTINVQANQLLASPAGFTLVALLALKAGGDDFIFTLLRFPLLGGIWLIATIIIVFVIRRVLRGEKTTEVFDKEGKRVSLTVEEAPFRGDEGGITLALSAAFEIILTLIVALYLF